MQLSACQSRGRGPELLPVDASALGADAALDEILSLSRRHHAVRFSLGRVPEARELAPMFHELGRLRREQMYGLSFSCVLPADVSADEAALLRAAGVRHATLEPPTEGGAVPPRVIQLQTVKRLHAAEIEVEWEIAGPGEDETAAQAAEWGEALAAARHLPPPAGVAQAPAGAARDPGARAALDALVARWRGEHTPWTLTYARGPGFVRVFDRRRGPGDWTFIVLNAQQAEVFLFCEQTRPLAEVAATLPGTPASQVRGFLEGLVQRGVMARAGDDAFLSVAIRRRLEERWASADY